MLAPPPAQLTGGSMGYVKFAQMSAVEYIELFPDVSTDVEPSSVHPHTLANSRLIQVQA